MDEEYYNWIHAYHWSEDEAKGEVYRAYQNGLSRDDNPFNNNDEWYLHLAWEDGRSTAAWDD